MKGCTRDSGSVRYHGARWLAAQGAQAICLPPGLRSTGLTGLRARAGRAGRPGALLPAVRAGRCGRRLRRPAGLHDRNAPGAVWGSRSPGGGVPGAGARGGPGGRCAGPQLLRPVCRVRENYYRKPHLRGRPCLSSSDPAVALICPSAETQPRSFTLRPVGTALSITWQRLSLLTASWSHLAL